MKIKLNPNQIFYWPELSDYNFRWNFSVTYDLTLFDGKVYKFETNFVYHIKERKIYYNGGTDFIPFDELNWEFRNQFNENGELVEFGSSSNFIFYGTKYIGDFEIDDKNRNSVFGKAQNPFNFSTENKINEMDSNRDKVKDWWIENESRIISEIESKKETYNTIIRTSIETLILD